MEDKKAMKSPRYLAHMKTFDPSFYVPPGTWKEYYESLDDEKKKLAPINWTPVFVFLIIAYAVVIAIFAN